MCVCIYIYMLLLLLFDHNICLNFLVISLDITHMGEIENFILFL